MTVRLLSLSRLREPFEDVLVMFAQLVSGRAVGKLGWLGEGRTGKRRPGQKGA